MMRTNHYIKWRLEEYQSNGERDNKPSSSFSLIFGVVVVGESIEKMVTMDTMSEMTKKRWITILQLAFRLGITILAKVSILIGRILFASLISSPTSSSSSFLIINNVDASLAFSSFFGADTYAERLWWRKRRQSDAIST